MTGGRRGEARSSVGCDAVAAIEFGPGGLGAAGPPRVQGKVATFAAIALAVEEAAQQTTYRCDDTVSVNARPGMALGPAVDPAPSHRRRGQGHKGGVLDAPADVHVGEAAALARAEGARPLVAAQP
jgi:hypothetical protein